MDIRACQQDTTQSLLFYFLAIVDHQIAIFRRETLCLTSVKTVIPRTSMACPNDVPVGTTYSQTILYFFCVCRLGRLVHESSYLMRLFVDMKVTESRKLKGTEQKKATEARNCISKNHMLGSLC